MINNKFTIIIPTRERAETLYYALKTCVEQDYENLEIIVSDNASKDDTEEIVKSFNDKRIIYLNTGKRLSMVDNFEFAFSQIRDGYVISIGDDDGLTFDAIKVVNEILNEEESEAIVSNVAIYNWPNHSKPNVDRLFFSVRNGYERRYSKDYINKAFYGNYHYNQMPCVYYGFIKADVIKEIIIKFKRLFLTNQVDIFSSVALSQRVESFIYSHSPLAIAGISKRSNGGSYMYRNSDDIEKKLWEAETNLFPDPPFVTIANAKVLMAEAYHKLEKNYPDFIKFKIDMKRLLNSAILESVERKNLNDVSKDIIAIGNYFGYNLKTKPEKNFSDEFYKLLSKFQAVGSNILLDCKVKHIDNVFTAANFIYLYKNHQKYRSRVFSKLYERMVKNL